MNRRNAIILIVIVFILAAVIAFLTSPMWGPLVGRETIAGTVVGTLAPSAEDVVITDTLPDLDAEPLLIAFGTFNAFDEQRRGEGGARVYDVPEMGWVLRLEDFRVPNQPGLHVVLSVNMPVAADTPLEFGYVDLGSIKGNAGDQNYPIPPDVDLSRFGAVVITDAAFSSHMTAAELTAG